LIGRRPVEHSTASGLFAKQDCQLKQNFVSKIKPEFFIYDSSELNPLNYLPALKENLSSKSTAERTSVESDRGGSPLKTGSKPFLQNSFDFFGFGEQSFSQLGKSLRGSAELTRKSLNLDEVKVKSLEQELTSCYNLFSSSCRSSFGFKSRYFQSRKERARKTVQTLLQFSKPLINKLRSAKLILKCFKYPKTKRDLIQDFVEGYMTFGSIFSQAQFDCYETAKGQLSKFLMNDKSGSNSRKNSGNKQFGIFDQRKFTRMSSRKLKETACKDRASSSQLQNFLKNSPDRRIAPLFEKLKADLFDMCFEKFGNYITQIFLERVPEFQDRFCDLAINNFDKMASNEYACRVLQKFILLKNQKMISHIISLVKADYRPFVRNLSFVIMLNKLILNLEDISRLSFLEDLIINQPEIVMEEPLAIRMLVSLFTRVDDNSLENLFGAIQPYLHHLMNHKFGIYLVQKIVEKKIDPFEEEIKTYLLKNLKSALNERTTKYIIFKIIDMERSAGEQKKESFFASRLLKVIFDNKERFFHYISSVEKSLIFLVCLFSLETSRAQKLLPKVTELIMTESRDFGKRSQCK
jgi:hypothetical protein